MTYKPLGRSGLRVSAISFGLMTLSPQKGETFDDAVGRAAGMLRVAIAGGVNTFDNAESYGSEAVFGAALAQLFEAGIVKRADLVITTKLWFGSPGGGGVNGNGLSRKHIVEGLQHSLARMRLAYVDVVLCHRSDPTTPIEETVRAMNHVMDKGMALYWGTSEWSAGDIAAAFSAARDLRIVGPIAEQTRFNMFWRERVELELGPLIKREGLGIMAFNPLAEGILAGRYNQDEIPEGSRFGRIHKGSGGKVDLTRQKFAAQVQAARKMGPLASALPSGSMAGMALAWMVSRADISTALVGASSVQQLAENLKAPSFAPLPDEVHKKLEELAAPANWPWALTVDNRVRELKGIVSSKGLPP